MASLAERRKEWVLETIDLLRQRKARPDFERISRMLERFHGLTLKETKDSLEALVSEEGVLKVHFKGNISYRRLTPMDSNHSSLPYEQANHSTSHRIITAIGTITKQTGDGVTFAQLEQWLISKNPETRLVKLRLHTALLKEIYGQTITKLSDNCYVLTDSLPKDKKSNQTNDSPKSKQSKQLVTPLKTMIENKPKEKENCNKTEEIERGRPLSQRKKIKKTHGPDFENPLQLRRLASRDGCKSGEITCDFCSYTARCNREGKQEPLLTCKDCSAKVHPSCMDYSEELAERALKTPWQCMDCKTCCICDGTEHDDLILFCDACDMGFHMTCHAPPVSTNPRGSWVCGPCKRRLSKYGDDQNRSKEQKECVTYGTIEAACLLTPSATPNTSPPPSDTFDYDMKMSLLGESLSITEDKTMYTDASNWNIDNVVKFFEENGFTEQSKVFRTQEIDGPSLLLMKRDDVLSALGLKLGPALKIYRKIVRLQQRSQVVTVS